MIETRVETRLICPPELRRSPPARPEIPADAVIEANASGGRWLSAELEFGSTLAALFADAAAACPSADH